jgi:hypothetical protein
MANLLEYAVIFQEGLDLVLEQAPVTGWMTADNDRVRYNGGQEYKFAKLTVDGLSDYSRSGGFVEGDVELEWETRKFEYDRGRTFSLDSQDYDETAFKASAPNIMGEFARTQVTPEVDLVRIARLAGNAEVGNVKALTNLDTILEDFKAGIMEIKESGYEGRLMAHVTFEVMNALELVFAKQLGAETFAINGVDTTFKTLDDVALIPTVKSRMFTKVTKDPTTKAITGSGDKIAFVIAGYTVPNAIAKHEKVRIFTPDENQLKDAWKLDYRLYHDLIVLDNAKPAIYVATLGE